MSEKMPESIPEKLIQEAKTQEELEQEWQQELIQAGQQFEKIEFKFVEPRLKIKAERLPFELDWDLFSEDISEEDRQRFSFLFSQTIEYLDAPIITDNFPNHNKRVEWEEKYLNSLKPEVQKYYQRNRLGLNFNSRFNKFYSALEFSQEQDNILDQDKFAQLQSFAEIIPKELENADLYKQLTTEKKIEYINNLDKLVSASVRLLGKKSIEKLN